MGVTPLLLLPGLLCDEEVWRPQVAGLAAQADCTVASYGTLSSLVDMARHALALMPDGEFALAGHSMGGRIALEIVRMAPERVSRLALLDTGYLSLREGLAGEMERRGRRQLLEVARTQGMRAVAREWTPAMVHPSRVDTPVFEEILRMIERKTPEIFAAQVAALLGRPDAAELLPQIVCPTLVLCGRQDNWSPPSQHEQMHALIPRSTLSVIEDAGHMVTMEQGERVTQALALWLQERI